MFRPHPFRLLCPRRFRAAILVSREHRARRKKSRTVRENSRPESREFFPTTFCMLCVASRKTRAGSTDLTGILVVDDHPVIAKACGLVLEPIGIEKIISAHDADTGYQAYIEHEPDVSVIDLSLDGRALDGIALIKRIRTHNAGAKILVFSMRS